MPKSIDVILTEDRKAAEINGDLIRISTSHYILYESDKRNRNEILHFARVSSLLLLLL